MAHDRVQLREKVELRTQELTAALAKEKSDKLPDERVVGLRAELSVVESALSGGWDNVSEVTAAQLAGWLESTKNLVYGKGKAKPMNTPTSRPMSRPTSKSTDEPSDKPGAIASSRAEDHDPQREVVNVRPSPKSPDLSNPTRSAGDFDNPSGVAPDGSQR